MRKNKSYDQIVKIGVITSCFAIFLLITVLYSTTSFINNIISDNIYSLNTKEVIEDNKVDSLELESEIAIQRNYKVDTPKEQSQHSSAESSKTHVFSGNSNNNTGYNTTNGSSTAIQSNNPFGTGGDGVGNGSVIGTSADVQGFGGDGPAGPGSGEGRKRLNDPSIDHIATDVDITINLKVTVNSEGIVVSALSTSKTTTTDQRIINQVIAAVKNQVKYSKAPGSGLVTQYITVKINVI
jgi:hypothetical protein